MMQHNLGADLHSTEDLPLRPLGSANRPQSQTDPEATSVLAGIHEKTQTRSETNRGPANQRPRRRGQDGQKRPSDQFDSSIELPSPRRSTSDPQPSPALLAKREDALARRRSEPVVAEPSTPVGASTAESRKPPRRLRPQAPDVLPAPDAVVIAQSTLKRAPPTRERKPVMGRRGQPAADACRPVSMPVNERALRSPRGEPSLRTPIRKCVDGSGLGASEISEAATPSQRRPLVGAGARDAALEGFGFRKAAAVTGEARPRSIPGGAPVAPWEESCPLQGAPVHEGGLWAFKTRGERASAVNARPYTMHGDRLPMPANGQQGMVGRRRRPLGRKFESIEPERAPLVLALETEEKARRRSEMDPPRHPSDRHVLGAHKVMIDESSGGKAHVPAVAGAGAGAGPGPGARLSRQVDPRGAARLPDDGTAAAASASAPAAEDDACAPQGPVSAASERAARRRSVDVRQSMGDALQAASASASACGPGPAPPAADAHPSHNRRVSAEEPSALARLGQAMGIRIHKPGASLAAAASSPSAVGAAALGGAGPGSAAAAAGTTPGAEAAGAEAGSGAAGAAMAAMAASGMGGAATDRSRPQPPDGSRRDVRGLRLSPAALVFRDVFEGERRALRFVLQNVCARPLNVHVVAPSSVFFSLGEPSFQAVLAPGLKHEDVVTLQQYCWRAEGQIRSSIKLFIDGEPEEYCIETHFAEPRLEVEPGQLDLGLINVGAPVLVRYLTVRNCGRLATSFAVDTVGGETGASEPAHGNDLTVRPARGRVQAFQHARLRCEFAPSQQGHFQHTIWVRGGGVACRVPLSVSVVRPRLEIQHPRTAGGGGGGASVLLNFGAVYFGAQDRLVATVRNNSADVCTFVVLAEMPNGVLSTLRNARVREPRLRVFRVHPPEGRLAGMETRIFTFGFNPQMWVDEEAGRRPTHVQDFQVFMRVARVACVDYGLENNQKDDLHSATKDSDTSVIEVEAAAQGSFVRVCLHGRAAPPALRLTPERALRVGRVALGASARRVLRLDNECARGVPPLLFRVARPPPGVRVAPARGAVRPAAAVELLVHVAPVAFGPMRARLRVELLAESRPLMAPEEIALLGARSLRVFCDCPAQLPPPAPRFSPGLTPLLTRQVGVVGDGVPFCSAAAKPRQALLCAYKVAGQRDKWGPLAARAPPTRPQARGEDEGAACDAKCRPCPLPLCCDTCEDEIRSPVSSATPVSSGSSAEAASAEAACAAGQAVLAAAARAAEAGRQVARMLVPELPPVAPGVALGPVAPPPSVDALGPWVVEGEEQSMEPPAGPVHAFATHAAVGKNDVDMSKFEDASPLGKIARAWMEKPESASPARRAKAAPRSRAEALLRPAPAEPVVPASAPASLEACDPAEPLLASASSESDSSLGRPAVRVFTHRRRSPPPPAPVPAPTPASASASTCTSTVSQPWATAVLSHVWEPPPTPRCLSVFRAKAAAAAVPRRRSARSARAASVRAKKRILRDAEWSKWDFDSSSSDGLQMEEPQSLPPATPMALGREAAARACAGAPAGAGEGTGESEAQGSARRCETLRWARGEQLHPHCAFIAFPNDTEQRSLRPWPANKLTRSIFTGAARWAAPPWREEALAPAEALARRGRADAARRALRQHEQRRRRRALAALAAAPRPPAPEYDVSNPGLYDYRAFRPDVALFAPAPDPDPPAPPLPSIGNKDALVPLTPSQLINVRLVPSPIDFGTVGIGSRVSVGLLVRNDNAVLVKLNVRAQSPQLAVSGSGVVYVPPRRKVDVKVTLKTSAVGRFNGVLRYVVNDCHALEAPVTAHVVVRALRLPVSELFFGFVHGYEEAWPKMWAMVPIHNPLQVPCRFEWEGIDNTCYDVLPRSGAVPALGVCACEVTLRLNADAPGPDAQLVLNTEGDGSLELSCGLLAPADSRPLGAGWVRPFLQLPNLSMMGRRRFVLQVFNASYLETLFRVLGSQEAVDGLEDDAPDKERCRISATNRVAWRVRPSQGTLRPRCVRNLYLTVRACAVGRATFRVRLALGSLAFSPPSPPGPPSPLAEAMRARRPPSKVAVQTICAEVLYPAVEAEPSELRFWRVSAGSHVCKAFRLRNVGSVEAWVEVAACAGAGADVLTGAGDWALSTRADSVCAPPSPLLLPVRAPPLELFLHFSPVDVASYEFVLPLRLNGAFGPAEVTRAQSRRNSSFGGTPLGREKHSTAPVAAPVLPCVFVEATVTRRVLAFSETDFAFVYNTCDRSNNVTEHQVYVESARAEAIFFWMPATPPGGAPFRVTALAPAPAAPGPAPAASAAAAPARGPQSVCGRLLTFCKLSQEALREHLQTLSSGRRPRASVDWTDAMSCASQLSICSASRAQEAQTPTPSAPAVPAPPRMRPFDEDDDDDKGDSVLCCTLAPGDVCTFGLRLEPQGPGTVRAELPVFTGGMSRDDLPVASLVLRAHCQGHSISLPVDELTLPPRPLNVPAEAKLHLTVEYEDDFDITWTLEDMRAGTGRITQACLNVCVMQQRVALGPHVARVPLSVVFKSAGALGLRARVVFRVSRKDGPAGPGVAEAAFAEASCALRVTAMADVSLCTTHFFSRVRHPRFSHGPPPPPGRCGPAPRGSRRISRVRSLIRGATLYSDEEFCDDEDTATEAEEEESTEQIKQKAEVRRSQAMRRRASVGSVASLPAGVQPSAMSAVSAVSAASAASSTSLPSDDAFVPRPSTGGAGVAPPLQSASQASFLLSPAARTSLRSGETPTPTPALDEHAHAEDSGFPVRRHRGLSRCGSDSATVDADMDSLASSEESEDSDVGRTASETLPSRTEASSVACGSFPAFPDANDVSEYALYMRRVQQAAEEWLYDVVMQHHYWITIPYGYNMLYRIANTPPPTAWESLAEKRRRGEGTPCPFHSLTPYNALYNIAGKTATDFVRKFMAEHKEEEWLYGEADLIIPGATLEGEAAQAPQYVPDEQLLAFARVKLRKYALILHIVRCNGGVLPHARPEYMIDYAMYKELVLANEAGRGSGAAAEAAGTARTAGTAEWSGLAAEAGDGEQPPVRPLDLGARVEGPLLSQRRHRQLSRQAWLDVSLQYARVFWLPKIDEEHRRAREAIQTDEMADEKGAGLGDLQFRSRQYYVASAAQYSEHELCLLAWLNERYAHARAASRAATPPHRHIGNFEADLADGVVLAYVTLDVCPYLEEYMPDIHPAPTKIEQAMHNAARVVRAWRALRLGFTVCVRDLVQPLALKMMLLVAFLYNVLPGLSGRATLFLSAPLGARAEAPLTLVNPSPHRLHYLAEFIGEAGACFEVLGGAAAAAAPRAGLDAAGFALTLAPSQRCSLRVGFHAHALHPRSCTLILSGVVQAPKFGRSLALRLEGRPSSLDVSATVEIRAALYGVKDHRLTLPVPYAASPDRPAPQFDLYLRDSQPTVAQLFAGCAWSQLRGRRVLRRLFLNQSALEVSVPADGQQPESRRASSSPRRPKAELRAALAVTVCALTPRTRSFWIGCASAEAGDFIVKVVTRVARAPALGVLGFRMPSGWRRARCTCGGRFLEREGDEAKCPLSAHALLPCANAPLRRAAHDMFKKTLSQCDLDFWKEHLDSSIGTQLMQLELVKDDGLVDEYAHIFNNAVTYSVSVSPDTISVPDHFHIPDVHAPGTVALPLHVGPGARAQQEWRLRLASADGRELRVYRLRAQLPPAGRADDGPDAWPPAPPNSKATRKSLLSRVARLIRTGSAKQVTRPSRAGRAGRANRTTRHKRTGASAVRCCAQGAQASVRAGRRRRSARARAPDAPDAPDASDGPCGAEGEPCLGDLCPKRCA